MTVPKIKSWADDLGTKPPSKSEGAAIATLPPNKRMETVARINKEYAIVLLGDRPAVLFEGHDAEGRSLVRILSVAGFQEWLRPDKTWTDTSDRPISSSDRKSVV